MRPLRTEDFAEVSEIAYATGYFGAPAGTYFPDQELFADLWIRPYFVAGPFGFGAERGGQLLGYIIGTPAWPEYRQAFARVLPLVLRRAASRGYSYPAGGLPYLLRALRFPNPHAPEALYPAHLHLNLAPESRGLGIGSALLGAYLDALATQGVPGVQLSTTLENQAAVALYQKHLLTVWSDRTSPLWQPWLGHPARHIVMTRSLARQKP